VEKLLISKRLSRVAEQIPPLPATALKIVERVPTPEEFDVGPGSGDKERELSDRPTTGEASWQCTCFPPGLLPTTGHILRLL
jgi:hypothetical protein